MTELKEAMAALKDSAEKLTKSAEGLKGEWAPLSDDEVPIIAQSGERILTREETKEYSEK